MPLVSLQFLAFVFAVTFVFYLLPRHQKWVLITASLVFVALANLLSLAALVLLTLFTQWMARAIAKAGRPSAARRNWLIALAGNILIILVFKYLESTPEGFYFDLSLISFRVNQVILILGLSFYCLQNIGYLTDVYMARMPPASLTDLFLYNGFFPKIIAGPILMPGEFFPFRTTSQAFDKGLIVDGSQRILLGLVKKLVIADRLSASVHSVFDYADPHPGITTLLAACLFTVQLYFDFSGYSDMAIGAAGLFGVRIKENFNFPLGALSVSEFWRKWHISLIDWLTLYLYYPVVFRLRRWKKWAAALGISITFLISGIWHGIGWTFLLWSCCHMVYLLIELFTKRFRSRINLRLDSRAWRRICAGTVFLLVSLSNVFFRATGLDSALRLFKEIFCGGFLPSKILEDLIAPLAYGGNRQSVFNFGVTLLLTGLFLCGDRWIYPKIGRGKANLAFILVSLAAILYFGVLGHAEKFIYTQF